MKSYYSWITSTFSRFVLHNKCQYKFMGKWRRNLAILIRQNSLCRGILRIINETLNTFSTHVDHNVITRTILYALFKPNTSCVCKLKITRAFYQTDMIVANARKLLPPAFRWNLTVTCSGKVWRRWTNTCWSCLTRHAVCRLVSLCRTIRTTTTLAGFSRVGEA